MGCNLICLGFLCSLFVQGVLSQTDVDVSSTSPPSFRTKWSSWINRDTPTTGDGDKERWTAVELASFCGNGKTTQIECITTDGIHSYSTGEIMECSIENGSVCLNADNFPIPCSDYEIRYFCEYYIISTTKKSATISSRQVTAHVNTFTTSPSYDATTINTFTTVHDIKGDNSPLLLRTWIIVLIAIGSTVIIITFCIIAIYVQKRFKKKKKRFVSVYINLPYK